jgi:predicted ABC-type ATPase
MSDRPDRLSKEEHQRIFRDELLPEAGLDRFTPQEHPKAIILAGQPGAGKGGLVRATRQEFGSDIFPIDPDEQRQFHPDAKRWQLESPYGWSQKTNADAGAWAGELRDAGVERRVNLIVDTTLGDAKNATRLIEGLQKAGYEVEVRAVATHRLESEHGVDERFTRRIDIEGVGRDVPLEFHDKVYRDLPENLDRVREATGVPVRIYDRSGAELYDSRWGPSSPGAVMNEARNARLEDPEITQKLRERWQAQAQWHRSLPERIERGELGLSPETSDALQREQLARGKVDLSAQRAEAAATVDEIIRPGAEPARPPIPGFELPPLGRAGATAGLASIGLAAAAYDAKETGERISTAFAQDNPSAVRSEATHFTARGVGGAAAMFTPAAAGVSGGPAVALAVADGVLLAEAFDRGAKFLDVRKITHQTGSDGADYDFNGKQWIREDLRADFRDDGVQKLQQQDFAAPPEIERELNAKASAEAVSQAIGTTKPRDPFEQPANPSDMPSTRPSPWRYEAQSGEWARTRFEEIDPTDPRLPDREVREVAQAERAAQLNRQALETIDRNIVDGPAVLAAQYQLGAKRNGFGDFGSEPEAVVTALNPNTLEASNGKQYVRDAQGLWSNDGTPATAERALELDATRERLAPVLAQHEQQLAETKSYEPPTPEQRDRAQLRQAYINEGWNPSPEQFEASYLAVKRTRQMSDLTAENSGLVLEKDANGQASLNSPILHTRMGPNNEVQIAAKTYPDEIEVARSDVRARGLPKEVVGQAAPAHAIEHATAEQREAREQAQREANRAGFSQDATDDVVRSAAPSMSGPGRRNGKADDTEREPLEEASPKRTTNGTDAEPTVPAPVPPDFAPSQQGLRDLRNPNHEGHDAYREMQHRAQLFETQNGIPHGPHTERLGASMLAFAVENRLHYSQVSLEKNQDTGQVQLKHAKYGEPNQYFPADLASMSSQPIEATSQRINETVSKHNANPSPAVERTQEQAQALGANSFEDKVMFARVRGGTPGHISDEHVGAAVLEAKRNGLDANNISQISMVGDHIRIAKSGPDDRAVLVDVNAPAPPLQASIEATNTVNQEQALAKQQALLQQQNPKPDGPDGPSGPTIGPRTM